MKFQLRRGLTLIELTVVLLILAATAGILVPRLVGYSTRAHGSAGASNIQEIGKALTLYETNQGSAPDNWDSLLEDLGGTAAPYAELIESGGTMPIAVGTLSAAEGEALNAIGITTIHGMNTDPENATFSPYETGVTETIDDSGTANCAILTPAAITDAGLVTGQRYAVFGVGAQSDLLGNVMTSVPVHFPEGGENPENVYLRFLVAYDIGDGTDTPERARLVGVFAIEPDSGELTTAGSHLGEYFEARGQ